MRQDGAVEQLLWSHRLAEENPWPEAVAEQQGVNVASAVVATVVMVAVALVVAGVGAGVEVGFTVVVQPARWRSGAEVAATHSREVPEPSRTCRNPCTRGLEHRTLGWTSS